MAATDSSVHPQEETVALGADYEMAETALAQVDLVDQILEGRNEEKCAENSLDLVQEPESSLTLDEIQAPNLDDLNVGNSITDTVPDDDCSKDDTCKENRKEASHIVSTLNSLHTTDEKLATLCKKYDELLEQHRTLQTSNKQSERRRVQMQKEREQLQAEHSKAILTRSRLESLCRELQRQNRTVKDESLMRVREEEEKRKEVSAKFQTTFNEITNMMQDNNQKSSKLREENMELATKLKSLIEQYESREQQVDKIVKHKELEVQLADAKLAKAAMEFTEEREKFLKDKHQCLQDLAEYQKKCQELTQNEIRLRTQLNLYTDKYEEFQQTLSKSNEVFTHFKDEMDKMSKKIKRLEKETGSWRSRWESSNKALLEMATEKQRRDAEYVSAQRKILQLEKLCRALQTERQGLLGQIKGDSTPAGPCIVPEATLGSDALIVNLEPSNNGHEQNHVPSTTVSENTTQDPVIPQDKVIEDIPEMPPTCEFSETTVVAESYDPPKDEIKTEDNGVPLESTKELTNSCVDTTEDALPKADVNHAATPDVKVPSKTRERNKKRNKAKNSN